MITLKEAKNYLRVDYDEDDKLIQNLLLTAKNLVMDVGRMDEDAFTQNEDTVRTAMLFALGYLYENRSNPDYQKLTLNLRSILFAQRGRDLMEIGNLNQRITILEHRTVIDEIGNHITKWEETFSCGQR